MTRKKLGLFHKPLDEDPSDPWVQLEGAPPGVCWRRGGPVIRKMVNAQDHYGEPEPPKPESDTP